MQFTSSVGSRESPTTKKKQSNSEGQQLRTMSCSHITVSGKFLNSDQTDGLATTGNDYKQQCTVNH